MAHLEECKRKAMVLMGDCPRGAELSIKRLDDKQTWLGIGWLVGKGWVAYAGDDSFAWTGAGRELAKSYLAE